MNRTKTSFSAILVLASLALLLAPTAFGYNPGLDGGLSTSSAGSGCLCHGAQDASVAPSLTVVGDGGALVAGETYTLEVSFTGGPDATGDNAGGFLMDANSGTFGAPDANVVVDGDEVTHSADGNDQRTWQVEWTAESTDTTEFTLRVNSVNGDGSATDDDDWNMATYYLNSDGTITQTLIEPEARLDVPDWTMNAIIAACLLLMLIMVMIGINKKPRGRRGEL